MFHSLAERVERSVPGAGPSAGSGDTRELKDLEFRLRAVEHRLQLLERQFDGWSEPAE